MLLFAEFVFESFTGGGPISVVRDGVGLSSVIAVVGSWHLSRSILWAVLAGILSWFYVIYFAVTRRPVEARDGLTGHAAEIQCEAKSLFGNGVTD